MAIRAKLGKRTVLSDYCQTRNDLLTGWSKASSALSSAAASRDLPEIENARRETQKAQEAFDAHALEHGCGLDHLIVK